MEARSERLFTVLVLAVIAASSVIIYTYNASRLGVGSEPVDCERFSFNIPPGTYRLNYTITVERLAGTETREIMFEFRLDNTTCNAVGGVAFIAGRMGVSWGSPTELGPFVLPSLDEQVTVNILPLPPYTPQAIAGYYPVTAVRTSTGILETPYGSIPVYAYTYTLIHTTEQGVLTETTTLYYEQDTGLLAGMDYNLFQGPFPVYRHSMRLSDVELQPPGAEITVKDPPTALAVIAFSGAVGGVALALAAAEASRRG